MPKKRARLGGRNRRLPVTDVRYLSYPRQALLRHQPRGAILFRVADVLVLATHLDHIDIDYVPAEGDVNSGIDVEPEDEAPMPWPDPEESQIVTVEDQGTVEATGSRSDDWTMRELKVNPMFDPMRGDPRFQKLVQKLKFG